MVWLAAVLALGAVQEDPSVERQVQRLREQLRLSDDQIAKVRDIVKKQMDELKAVLTDEQKPRLESGGERRGGPPGSSGGRPRGLPDTDELKEKLSLTEAQAAKINELRDQAREEMRRYFQNRSPRDGGGEEIGRAIERMRTEAYAKIRETLTDEQKPKYDEILKEVQAATPTFSGDSSRGRGGSVDDRVARTMEVLKFDKPEEAEAVKGLVRKVYEAMEKVEAAQREARGKVEELTRATELSDEAVGDKLVEIRKPLKELEKALADARTELADVLTARQEAELLRRGVLR